MPDFVELITRGREDTFLEYKRSAPWETLRPQLIKTCLAMANIRDGGYIVVGVTEENGEVRADGMEPADQTNFSNDTLQEQVNRYADPFVSSQLQSILFQDRVFVVIAVRQFEDVPVVCRRDGPQLRRGAIYTRSRRKPETTEIQRSEDMRELLELATTVRVRKFRSLLAESGIQAAPSALEKFDKEIADL